MIQFELRLRSGWSFIWRSEKAWFGGHFGGSPKTRVVITRTITFGNLDWHVNGKRV